MSKEVENLILENKELIATKKALNIVKDDLIVKVDELTSEQETLKKEIYSLRTAREELKQRVFDLEGDLKESRNELGKVKEKQATGPQGDEGEVEIPIAQIKRFTRVEMARVLMERNQYKERLMKLQEAVHWTEMVRASKEHPNGSTANKKKGSIWNLYSGMATAKPLEDQVKCSACFNIYNRGQIECPKCQLTIRRNVKSCFKTQEITEISLQQTSKERVIALAKCGMCHSPDKAVRYCCIECVHYMCDGCHEEHAGMKVCKHHKVKSIAKIIEKSEKHFKELIHEFEKEERQIHQKASQVDKNIMTIEECERGQLVEVKKITEDAIRDLKENEKRLNKIIQDANTALIRNLKERKGIFTKGQAEIQNKIDFLNDLIKGQDVNTLIESADNIKHSFEMAIEKIQSSLPDVLPKVESPVTIRKGEDWNAKGYIEVKVGELLYGSTAMKPLLQSLYSDICKTEYVETKSVTLANSPLKLCQIKQEIWCCEAKNKKSVYNKQCQKVKDIIHSELGYIRGMALTYTNHVIVAGDNGLHQLDINGHYQERVAEGWFSDVSTYGKQVYALDYHKNKILMFRYINKWKRSCEININYSNGDGYDKLGTSNDSIYVSSENGNCIYKYNFKGELQHEIRQNVNNLHLCGVDSRGNLLIADYTKHQIQVFDREGSVRVVHLSGEISGPIHALLDNEGSIWVARFSNGELTKFESK